LTFLITCLILLFPAAPVKADDARPKTYIRMEETEIIGVVEHPEITYIIPKTRIRFSEIPLDRNFYGEATQYTNPMALERDVRTRALITGP
jgi:hypothetical protein